jgi:hypothetical protein
MAKGPDKSSVIERLRLALERAKLLAEDAVFESQPMSELVGFSWPTVRKWCDTYPALEASGVFVRGGNGVKWQFHPVGFIQSLIDQFSSEAVERGERNRKLQQQIGVTLPESEATADLDDTRKLLAMTFDVNDRKVRQGNYTPAEEAADFVEGYNRTVVDSVMGVATQIDPTGHLPPEIREKVNEALIGVASQIHARATKFVEEQRARIQQTGVGLSR